MRETQFIKQNKDKWQEFETVLDSKQKDPEKLKELFVQITDDLSYSRTFYTNRSVRVYLNSLAQRIFFQLYKSRKSHGRRLLSFWTDELPQLIYESRKAFRLSFLIFLLACLIGGLSSAMDPEFATVILGEDYVEMTLENIESGDPMAVYKQRGEFGMSMGITLNNLFVAFLTFVMGAFYMVGSMVFLLRNGIMLGAFQYFFIERGLFWDSFLTIWIHGTLEISAIIIAGAAGLTMGRGLVVPGTYSRMQAFQRSARRGVKIMVGIVPIIIMAGFIEGYLTRHTDTPEVLRGLFILVCLLFVLLYFVWYPRLKASIGFDAPVRESKAPPDRRKQIQFEGLRSSGEIYADTFVFFRKNLNRFLPLSVLLAVLYCGAVFGLSGQAPDALFSFPNRLFGAFSVLDQFFINEGFPLIWVLNIVLFSTLAVVVFRTLIRAGRPEAGMESPALQWLKALLGLIFVQVIIWTQSGVTILLILLVLPAPLLWIYSMMSQPSDPVSALTYTLRIFQYNFSRVLGLNTTLLLTGILFFSIVDTVLLWFFLDLVSWVIPLEEASMEQFSVVFLTFISCTVIFLISALLLSGFGLIYYVLAEIREATQLMEQVQRIGTEKKIRGLSRE